MLIKIIIYIIVGIVSGAINASAGGGTILAFPIFMLFGSSALVANGTSNIPIMFGQLSSSIGYFKHLKKIPIKYYLIAIPCILGTVLGAYLLTRTPNLEFEEVTPFLIISALVLFIFQPYIVARIYRAKKPYAKLSPPIWLIVVTGILSVYAGYYGGGFGLAMLALLSISSLDNIHQMNGLKNILGFLEAALSIIILNKYHLIDLNVGLVTGLGAIFGGYFGAKYANKISLKYLRIIVILIGVLTTAYFVLMIPKVSYIFKHLL
ncbi:MAG: sulfite exporter TauE/SafE family protein [Patescibacteria group bacterium]|jgi:uncharacterized membrane protein YfcA|nr:sulfite exporter TauE/SafE family protein [Patescibacteria group bacterium]